jgi:hypothetical protein
MGPADHFIAAHVDPLQRRIAALSAEVEERVEALTAERDAIGDELVSARACVDRLVAERDRLRGWEKRAANLSTLRKDAVARLERERDALRRELDGLGRSRSWLNATPTWYGAARQMDLARGTLDSFVRSGDGCYLDNADADTLRVMVVMVLRDVITLLDAIAATNDQFLCNAERIDARSDLKATAAKIAEATGYTGGQNDG